MLKQITARLPQSSRAILGGLLAFGLAELSVRLVRLFTVILIARQLAPEIVGQAALTLILFELIRILANIGVGQQIIATSQDQLAAVCNTAHRVFWVWCGLVAAVQLSVACALSVYFGQVAAGKMLAALSIVYAFMPGGLVQCYLLMREGRASVTARTAAVQAVADHILTAALLLLWPNPWSIVLPKLLTAPIWLVLTRGARSWQPEPAAGRVPYRTLFGFGFSVLAAEMAVALRTQADKLIISVCFGVTALGTYFFAFNAGIGIVSSLITAFGTVVFPSLCAVPTGRARARRMTQALVLGLIIFLPILFAQSVLASFYVPIIFGDHWVHAAPLIASLCLAGLPMLAITAMTAWLRAEGQPHLDAQAQWTVGLAAIAGLTIGASFGSLEAAAAGWVAAQILVALPIAAHFLKKPILSSLPQIHKGVAA